MTIHYWHRTVRGGETLKIPIKINLKLEEFYFFLLFLKPKKSDLIITHWPLVAIHILIQLHILPPLHPESQRFTAASGSSQINHATTFPLPIFSLSFGTSETFEIHFFISGSRRRRKQHLHFKGLFSSGQPSRDTLWNNSARSLPQS